MRKKTISHFFDEFMWWLLYLLPVFVYLFLLIKGSAVGFADVMQNSGLLASADSVVFNALNSLFGANGVLPLFASADMLYYGTYFVNVWLLHIAVDVLLWIIRYAHSLIDCFGGKHE